MLSTAKKKQTSHQTPNCIQNIPDSGPRRQWNEKSVHKNYLGKNVISECYFYSKCRQLVDCHHVRGWSESSYAFLGSSGQGIHAFNSKSIFDNNIPLLTPTYDWTGFMALKVIWGFDSRTRGKSPASVVRSPWALTLGWSLSHCSAECW